jgi:hypothetical protein
MRSITKEYLGKYYLSPHRSGLFTKFERIVKVIEVDNSMITYLYINNSRLADQHTTLIRRFEFDFKPMKAYDSPLWRVLND